jgi:hypothetical protein
MKWRKSGEGPDYIRLGVRRIGYYADDLERWIASHRNSRVAPRKPAAASTSTQHHTHP